MGRTAKKLNFLIEESVWRDLETMVPAGKRSKVANDALRRELDLIGRRRAVENILANGTKAVSYTHLTLPTIYSV